jgi:tartrate-resistant acid phosphatase type 5
MAIGKDSILVVFLDTDPIEIQLRGIPADRNKYLPGYVGQQLDWLKKVLGSSTARWKIVVGHHPLYTGGSRRHNRRVKKLRNLLQPVLSDNKVNFYLSGHEHHLEFLKPKGPTPYYIISGSGSKTGHVGWLKRYRRFAARKRGFVSISISSKGWLIQFISDKEKVIYKYSL